MRNRSTFGHDGSFSKQSKKRRQRRSRMNRRMGADRLQMETLEPRVVLAVVISEFQASNDTTLADEENDFEDWIELHNTGLAEVDLGGWYLTDTVNDLTQWRIPDETRLGGDEFLVVFASNKDSNTDPSLTNLHTNFQLSAGGEFLALVEDDGLTIASEYSPEYPPQLTDQSYGLAVGRDTVLLLDTPAPATADVPANNALGTSWTEVGFNDASWLSGTTAVGFEELAPGFSTRDDFDADLGPQWTVDIPAGGTSTYVVEDGKLKVDLPGNQNSFADRGLAPFFLQDAPQLKSNYEMSTQVSLTTGSGAAGLVVTDGTTGTPAFSVQFNRASSFISQIQTITGDEILNTRVQFSTTSVFVRIERDLFADTWTTSFKLNEGDAWEELFTATEGIGGVPQTSAPEIGLIARTSTNVSLPAEFDFFELNVGDERPVYGPQTGIDVGDSMRAENNASVYVRVPFTVTGDPSRFDELDMSVEYDDGFIVYLNGVEVERRFAPIESSWDSAASASHGAVDGQIPTEVINLNAHVGLLTEGENILAFHGMNVAVDDGDFYLNPTLSGAEILSTTPQVFLTPTPGSDNTLPAAPQPVFSAAGGTYIGSKVVEITNPNPGANFQIRYTTDGTPPSPTSPLYTGPLTFTNSVWLRAKIFDTSFTQAFSPSNATAASYIALNQSLANRDSDLPILVLDTLGQSFPNSGSSDLQSALVAMFDTDPVTGRAKMFDGNLDYSGLGGARRRGSSTGGNAKPPLKFETWGAFDDDFDVPLLGMPANSDWVLYAPFNFDRTLIHEPFIYSLSNDIGSYASRTIPIEVYANVNGGVVDANDYYGVYILMERIKRGNGRVDITRADPNARYDPSVSVFDQPDEAITGGYLWKIDRGDPGEPPFNAGGYSINWQYPSNHSDPSTTNAQQVTDDQQAYVTAYINEFGNVLDGPNAYDPVDGYAKYIDVDAWIDNHLLNIITMNVDAQRLSAYFHKDVGKKLAFGPVWDFDRALESTDGRDDDPLEWRGKGGDLGTDFFGESGNGMGGRWWRQLFDDPNFFSKYIDRYWELRRGDGLFSTAAIDARIDYWADLVRESSARNINDVPSSFRQAPRTGGCHGVTPGEPSACNGTFQGEVENMRAWLHRRLKFMDDTFPVNPTISLNDEVLPPLPAGVSVSAGAEVTGIVPDKPDPVMLFDDTVLLSGEPGAVPITYFVPLDDSLGDTWAAVDFDDAAWETGTNGIGYQNVSITDYTDLITTSVKPRDMNGAATIMTRTEFTIDDPAAIDDLVLQVKYDDNYIAYLNGTEVARKGIVGAPIWNQGAGSHPNSDAVEFDDVDISDFKDLVVAGTNVLAIHVINSTVDVLFDLGIADMLLLPQVVSRVVTVLPNDPGGILYYTTDGTDPRGLDDQPSPTAAVLGRDDTIVITENTRVIFRNLDDIDHGPQSNLVTTDWSAPITHDFIVETGALTITEINYNPADPSDAELTAIPGVNNDDFEFIEILNTGAQTMDLTGVELTNGVTFDFTTSAITSLDPDQYMLVVSNQAAFELRYGNDLPIAGEYEGNLANGGERLTLVDGLENTLFSTEYSDGRIWPQTADGVGATLELIDPEGTSAELSDKHYVWRGSTDVGGSPGAVGADPIGVVINEILAHSDPPAVDTIELLNTTDSQINIGGWYLSDAAGDLQKFQIPAGTMLGAGQYIVFDETNFNVDGDENGFALSSGDGDDVWLTIPDGNADTASFVDDVHFIATLAGESLGRVPNGEGALAPMVTNTFGGENSLPRVGPLIISEVNYNPGVPSAAALAIAEDLIADDLEFVEIHNPTGSAVDLTDWRLRGAIDDTIAEETMIGVGETVVLISFNPDNPDNILRLGAFRAHYGINESVRLLGGYNGELSDNGELVELQRADHPEPAQPLVVAHVSEDFVIYDNVAPWPTGASGSGSSLHRSAPTLFGNSADSWIAATPSPGSAAFGDLPGDFNGDNSVDAADINILFGAISTGNMAAEFDLNNSDSVDQNDVEFLVENIIGTFMGDATLDGRVNATDLNQVGINWQRMDGAGWENGDFTGDGAVNAQDLNLIGINWRSGEAAAAAHGRVPRAPLAAAQKVPVAIVDVAIEDVVAQARGRADRDAALLPSDATSSEYGFEVKRARYDALSFRRDFVRGAEASDQADMVRSLSGSVQLVRKCFVRGQVSPHRWESTPVPLGSSSESSRNNRICDKNSRVKKWEKFQEKTVAALTAAINIGVSGKIARNHQLGKN